MYYYCFLDVVYLYEKLILTNRDVIAPRVNLQSNKRLVLFETCGIMLVGEEVWPATIRTYERRSAGCMPKENKEIYSAGPTATQFPRSVWVDKQLINTGPTSCSS